MRWDEGCAGPAGGQPDTREARVQALTVSTLRRWPGASISKLWTLRSCCILYDSTQTLWLRRLFFFSLSSLSNPAERGKWISDLYFFLRFCDYRQEHTTTSIKQLRHRRRLQFCRSSSQHHQHGNRQQRSKPGIDDEQERYRHTESADERRTERQSVYAGILTSPL